MMIRRLSPRYEGKHRVIPNDSREGESESERPRVREKREREPSIVTNKTNTNIPVKQDSARLWALDRRHVEFYFINQ